MKITGLQSCLDSLKFDESRIETILETAGSKILADTKSGIGQVDSTVASSYNMFVTKNENGWIVNVGSDIALSAFYEWGTGDFVVVPPETTDAYTMQWFRTGRGTLRPYPHLLPAFRQYRDKIVEMINEELKKQF